MYHYSKTELFRKYIILLKNALKGEPASLIHILSFIIRYSYKSFYSNKKEVIYLDTQDYGRIWVRTRSSDLEVFFQHFIYNELLHKDIKALTNINTILDLGGNIGFATIILAKLFPVARIISVELEPSNYEILQKNCQTLIRAERVETLLGAFYPRKDVKLSLVAGSSGDWNFFITEDEPAAGQNIKEIFIYTMDDILRIMGGKTPDLIKMDIEGGEVGFLKDDLWCNKVLPACNLILELHTFDAYDLYFYQLRKNNIRNAVKVGEYWMTKKTPIYKN